MQWIRSAKMRLWTLGRTGCDWHTERRKEVTWGWVALEPNWTRDRMSRVIHKSQSERGGITKRKERNCMSIQKDKLQRKREWLTDEEGMKGKIEMKEIRRKKSTTHCYSDRAAAQSRGSWVMQRSRAPQTASSLISEPAVSTDHWWGWGGQNTLHPAKPSQHSNMDTTHTHFTHTTKNLYAKALILMKNQMILIWFLPNDSLILKYYYNSFDLFSSVIFSPQMINIFSWQIIYLVIYLEFFNRI